MERGILACRQIPGISEALTGTGVVETNIPIEEADALKQVEGADGDAFQGFHRLLEG